jgi:serine protease Do
LNENFFGVEEFANAPEGGVTFNDVYPPDGPADKAGLVGGDIIKTVDGRAVNQSKDIFDLLRATPTGKTLEINYVRDGEGRTTKLTTISEEQFDGLIEKFEDRAEGHGQLGYEDIATRVIALPGSNISGVQLHRLGSSGPAVLAGVQEGDIVIAVDGVPIRKRGELIQRVRRAVPYSTIKLVVMRGNQRLEIPVKVGKR